MNRTLTLLLTLSMVLTSSLITACKGSSRAPKPTTIISTNPPTVLGPKIASLVAEPNPIVVCDGSGYGVCNLSWTSVGPSAIEIHVNSPNGDVLAATGPNGTATTGKWVNDGTVFYLQDVTGGKSRTPENTWAAVTVKVSNAGCK